MARPTVGGKLRALARVGLPVIEAFDRSELGVAIGRDEVVHVAMAPGGLAKRLLAETAPASWIPP